jgi:hypothetical protein
VTDPSGLIVALPLTGSVTSVTVSASPLGSLSLASTSTTSGVPVVAVALSSPASGSSGLASVVSK